MKKLLLFLAIAMISTCAFPQKNVILVKEFSHASNVGTNYTVAIRNNVIQGIADMQRLQILDEQNGSDGLGATFILDGHVTSIDVTRSTNSSNKTTYSCKINFQLKVTNVEDNTIIASKSLESSASSGILYSYYAESDALADAVKYVNSKMKGFVNEVFPLEGEIVEINETKKDEAKQLYIGIGSDHGVIKGQKFDVYAFHEVAGRSVRKKIGELKAEAVEAGDLTLCKVTKEGRAILTAVNEGRRIVAISK